MVNSHQKQKLNVNRLFLGKVNSVTKWRIAELLVEDFYNIDSEDELKVSYRKDNYKLMPTSNRNILKDTISFNIYLN